MAYSWTTLSATKGQLITPGGLQTALNQANDMYNSHHSSCSSVNSGYNTSYKSSNDSNGCNALGCSTHYSAFAKKCGAFPLNALKIWERIISDARTRRKC